MNPDETGLFVVVVTYKKSRNIPRVPALQKTPEESHEETFGLQKSTWNPEATCSRDILSGKVTDSCHVILFMLRGFYSLYKTRKFIEAGGTGVVPKSDRLPETV